MIAVGESRDDALARARGRRERNTLPRRMTQRDATGLPAPRDRRGGDRGRRGCAPVGLADHRATRCAARGADGRVPGGEARAGGRLGDGGNAPRARRARDRARRRGDHDPDHLAGDRERDRPHGRDARLRRRARRRSQHRSGARRGGRDRADEGDHARAPRRPAVRPGPDLGARHPRDRGRRPRGRERLPRPEARRALGGDVLLALRHEEHHRGRGRPHLDERRRRRRGDPRPAPDAPRRRLALRPHRPRLQGEPVRRAGGDRARPARQAAERTPRSESGSSRSTTRGSPVSTGSSRSSATRATRTRATSTSSACGRASA